mgnify:CR=1 FL=1|jgi:hypothetical protein|tara:strand:- start:298 stop:537 length:240 start_codon:yes stop_codon:yes gene_type:complete
MEGGMVNVIQKLLTKEELGWKIKSNRIYTFCYQGIDWSYRTFPDGSVCPLKHGLDLNTSLELLMYMKRPVVKNIRVGKV